MPTDMTPKGSAALTSGGGIPNCECFEVLDPAARGDRGEFLDSGLENPINIDSKGYAYAPPPPGGKAIGIHIDWGAINSHTGHEPT